MDSWFLAPRPSVNTAAGASTPSISSKTFRSPSAIILARTARFTAAITITQEANKMNLVPLGNVVAALVFALVGIFIFVIAFMVMDQLTPYHLWTQVVQAHDIALAILAGATS